MNTVLIEYRQFQVDIHIFTKVTDSFGKVVEEHFETDTEANNYVDNLPSDYYVTDTRPNQTRRYYVRDFRNDRYSLD